MIPSENMAARMVQNDLNGHGVKINGFDDIPRPFLIGVGGGTASGKVEYKLTCNLLILQG